MIAEGHTDTNPVSGTNKTGSKASERVLQDFELAAIWSALGDDDYGDICRLLMLTGARRDEVGSLLRDEINFAQKQIELPGSRTKSGVDHIIPLSPLALSILTESHTARGQRFRVRAWRWRFFRLVAVQGAARCALDLEPWVLHDFRRALSTVLHGRFDVAPHIVEAILGHISGHKGGIGGVYNKAEYLDQRRAALEKYADHIKGLTRARLAVVK